MEQNSTATTAIVQTTPELTKELRNNLFLFAIKYALEEVQHYNSQALEKKYKLSVAAIYTYVANETMKQHGPQRPAIYSYSSFQSYLIQNNLAEPSTATKVASCPSTIDLVIQLKDDNKRKVISPTLATTTHSPYEKKKKQKHLLRVKATKKTT